MPSFGEEDPNVHPPDEAIGSNNTPPVIQHKKKSNNAVKSDAEEEQYRNAIRRHIKKLKKRIDNDEGKPKRLVESAYFVFINQERTKMQFDPGTPMTEQAKRMGDLWRSMSDEEKEKYKQEADHNKEVNKGKMEEWKENKETEKKNKLASLHPQESVGRAASSTVRSDEQSEEEE